MELKDITEDNIEDIADSPAIMSRGRSYFLEGRVINLRITNKNIIAIVQGGSKYKVEIFIDDDDEVDAECDCPYDGYGCKHIVAVLYKLINDKNKQTSITSVKNKASIAGLTFSVVKTNVSDEELLNALILSKNAKLIHKNQYEYKVQVTDKESVTIFLNRLCVSPTFAAACTCMKQGWTDCEHKIAAFLFLLKNKKGGIPRNLEASLKSSIQKKQFLILKDILDNSANEKQDFSKDYKIFFIFTKNGNDIEFSIEKSLILKGGGLGKSVPVTENFIKCNLRLLSSSQQSIFNVMLASIEEYYSSSTKLVKKKFCESIDFELLKKIKSIYFECSELFKGCTFVYDVARMEIRIDQNSDDKKKYLLVADIKAGEMSFDLSKNARIIGDETLWVYSYDENSKIFTFAEMQTTNNQQLIKKIGEISKIELSNTQVNDFIDNYFGVLSRIGNVVLPKSKKVIERDNIFPKPRIFVREHELKIILELRFLYDQKEVVYGADNDVVFKDKSGIVKIHRKFDEEKQFYNILLDSKVMLQNNIIVPSIDPYVWLADVTKDLIARGFEIFGEDALVHYKINKCEPTFLMSVSSGIDWFDLKGDVEFGDEKVSFIDIAEQLQKQERFVKLSDGSIGVIPQSWLSKIGGVIGFLEKDKKRDSLKASRSHINMIESILGIAHKSIVDDKFSELREKFRHFNKIEDAPLPKGLQGQLRDYQKAGYNWLHFLKDFSFGGCLADEMGLGKTLQVLTLLMHEKEAGNKMQSIIVVPTSLVFNWNNEIQKFTPTLNVYIHHGLERKRDFSKIHNEKPDVIITTYGTLRNDIDFFKNQQFNYAVLDESQNIKNPISQNAKSTYCLNALHRLILTGTPIENNSLELWSQFAFINPGLLGGIEYFKNSFAKQIEKEKNKNKTEALKNTIYPFILSRKKDMVAKDLPDKQITTLYCEMSDAQRIVYDLWKEKYKQQITQLIKERGVMQSKLKVLEGLTMLRQICNHPLLVDESYASDSGKFNILIEQIKEVIGEGHKVLVFSAFVKMLAIFSDLFEKENISFCYLDGQTKDRKGEVEKFQKDNSIRVFLVSLKAGGLGLNLTEADYVFIVDPWWNPAAEMQAIDRCHRIGQTKKVFVYKTIVKDSIEEKILTLQESKIELVKNIISIEENIFKKLNQEDINNLFA